MTRQSYATEIRIIRLMCTGRVDISFILRALRGGADGVIVGGCWPGECHYVTNGNYDALGNALLLGKLLARIGLAPGRLRLEWISAAEGTRFAEIMSDFARQLRELGPIGEGEGIAAEDLALRLAALNRLVPWLKLTEREKLRAPVRTEEAIRAHFESDEVNRLVAGPVAAALAGSMILTLLAERPHSTREISERLALTPSEVSRHMGDSARRGLVTFDVEEKRYALA